MLKADLAAQIQTENIKRKCESEGEDFEKS